MYLQMQCVCCKCSREKTEHQRHNNFDNLLFPNKTNYAWKYYTADYDPGLSYAFTAA